jgi:uncharacterized protein YdhG (YjbR/CyaY superfamily)
MIKIKDIDSYINKFSKEDRQVFSQFRKVIHGVSKFEETVAYNMPAFKYKEKIVACVAINKNHVGLYPYSGNIIKLFPDDLKRYKTSVGAVQFPKDQKFSKTLISKIIKARMKEIDSNLTKSKPLNIHKVYHKDGSLWAKGNMEGKNMEGYWQWFRKDGTKMRTGYFKTNKQIGDWKTYDKLEKLVKITNFDK